MGLLWLKWACMWLHGIALARMGSLRLLRPVRVNRNWMIKKLNKKVRNQTKCSSLHRKQFEMLDSKLSLQIKFCAAAICICEDEVITRPLSLEWLSKLSRRLKSKVSILRDLKTFSSHSSFETKEEPSMRWSDLQKHNENCARMRSN